MTIQAGQVYALLDNQRRNIGEVTIERLEGELLFASIHPGVDFAAVVPLFRAFEEAVELQALKKVDELAGQIAALKLQLASGKDREPMAIHDVQVWSDGAMTCRLRPVAPSDGKGADLAKGADLLSLAEVKRQLG
jgi:hypothetical protein